MNDSVRILPASHVHRNVLSALHGVCFDQGWSEKAMADMLAIPGAFARLAVINSVPHGFILCTTAADECEVVAIGTVPESRGRGLATKLLDAARHEALRAGCAAMFLEVAEDNKAAISLYRKHGFALAGQRKNYYTRPDQTQADALILRLFLSE